ncbi:hypothetical protein [Mycobacterium sp. 852014-52144_SCH5372336]|uniref:hypothetical protein n=1 Tax=Mycobacterium sp. 852014-52144_SCH5372336 TaxID=1834115 RepID=UPI0009EE3D0D|nr:hypothetical protein [Mycobacterium sp. 852014-52144_SCH5372336]
MPGGNSNDHDRGGDPPQQPWYNRTPEVVGASLLGLVAIGLLVLAVSFVADRSSEPAQAPLNYVEPTFTPTETQTATTATTGTVATTSPPETTEINDPPPSETTTSGSETTSSSETTTSSERPPTSEADVDRTTTRTTRRPRTNVTRTLYPYP